jgi:hypothetical protein
MLPASQFHPQPPPPPPPSVPTAAVSTNTNEPSPQQSLDTNKKQQRLAAWRQRQQQNVDVATTTAAAAVVVVPQPPSVKVAWTSMAVVASKNRKRKKSSTAPQNPTSSTTSFFESTDDMDENGNKKSDSVFDVELSSSAAQQLPYSSTTLEIMNELDEQSSRPLRKKSRWDSTAVDSSTAAASSSSQQQEDGALGTASSSSDPNIDSNVQDDDTLDQFMVQLQAVSSYEAGPTIGGDIVSLSGSVQRPSTTITTAVSSQSSFTTLDQSVTILQQQKPPPQLSVYNPSDWLSDTNPMTDNEEDDDDDRWALIHALKKEQAATDPPIPSSTIQAPIRIGQPDEQITKAQQLTFKEQHHVLLKELEEAAIQVRNVQQSSVADIGREFFPTDEEDGIVEEAIREYEAAQQQPESAILLLNEGHLNKKKELTTHHHESIPYEPFQKNIYRVGKSVALLTSTEITNRRAKLRIRVRGVQVPAPVLQFHEMGFPESILQYMIQQQTITTPYPIQAQCIPCILAGRDVIGIAKTGSGKTLAYVLPMLRHIIIQPPLGSSSSSSIQSTTNSNKNLSSSSSRCDTGPIALILVPARELAFQIHSVCKPYAKLLGLK